MREFDLTADAFTIRSSGPNRGPPFSSAHSILQLAHAFISQRHRFIFCGYPVFFLVGRLCAHACNTLYGLSGTSHPHRYL